MIFVYATSPSNSIFKPKAPFANKKQKRLIKLNLFINSPIYYTQQYGIDDDIYQLCSYISNNIDIAKYTTAIDTMAITPIIAPKELEPDKLRRARIFVTAADISIPLSYEEYVDGDVHEKKKMIIENIIDSAQVLKKKLKSKFNFELFSSDLEQLILKY